MLTFCTSGVITNLSIFCNVLHIVILSPPSTFACMPKVTLNSRLKIPPHHSFSHSGQNPGMQRVQASEQVLPGLKQRMISVFLVYFYNIVHKCTFILIYAK